MEVELDATAEEVRSRRSKLLVEHLRRASRRRPDVAHRNQPQTVAPQYAQATWPTLNNLTFLWHTTEFLVPRRAASCPLPIPIAPVLAPLSTVPGMRLRHRIDPARHLWLCYAFVALTGLKLIYDGLI